MKSWAMLILVLSACSGCATDWNTRGDSFTKEGQTLSSMMGNLRPTDQSLNSWGLSTKAQQIENSMGVR